MPDWAAAIFWWSGDMKVDLVMAFGEAGSEAAASKSVEDMFLPVIRVGERIQVQL
jgi:hypothetical protein